MKHAYCKLHGKDIIRLSGAVVCLTTAPRIQASVVASIKPRPHQQQCRSNVRLCSIRQCCFDTVAGVNVALDRKAITTQCKHRAISSVPTFACTFSAFAKPSQHDIRGRYHGVPVVERVCRVWMSEHLSCVWLCASHPVAWHRRYVIVLGEA